MDIIGLLPIYRYRSNQLLLVQYLILFYNAYTFPLIYLSFKSTIPNRQKQNGSSNYNKKVFHISPLSISTISKQLLPNNVYYPKNIHQEMWLICNICRAFTYFLNKVIYSVNLCRIWWLNTSCITKIVLKVVRNI